MKSKVVVTTEMQEELFQIIQMISTLSKRRCYCSSNDNYLKINGANILPAVKTWCKKNNVSFVNETSVYRDGDEPYDSIKIYKQVYVMK